MTSAIACVLRRGKAHVARGDHILAWDDLSRLRSEEQTYDMMSLRRHMCLHNERSQKHAREIAADVRKTVASYTDPAAEEAAARTADVTWLRRYLAERAKQGSDGRSSTGSSDGEAQDDAAATVRQEPAADGSAGTGDDGCAGQTTEPENLSGSEPRAEEKLAQRVDSAASDAQAANSEGPPIEDSRGVNVYLDSLFFSERRFQHRINSADRGGSSLIEKLRAGPRLLGTDTSSEESKPVDGWAADASSPASKKSSADPTMSPPDLSQHHNHVKESPSNPQGEVPADATKDSGEGGELREALTYVSDAERLKAFSPSSKGGEASPTWVLNGPYTPPAERELPHLDLTPGSQLPAAEVRPVTPEQDAACSTGGSFYSASQELQALDSRTISTRTVSEAGSGSTGGFHSPRNCRHSRANDCALSAQSSAFTTPSAVSDSEGDDETSGAKPQRRRPPKGFCDSGLDSHAPGALERKLMKVMHRRKAEQGEEEDEEDALLPVSDPEALLLPWDKGHVEETAESREEAARWLARMVQGMQVKDAGVSAAGTDTEKEPNDNPQPAVAEDHSEGSASEEAEAVAGSSSGSSSSSPPETSSKVTAGSDAIDPSGTSQQSVSKSEPEPATTKRRQSMNGSSSTSQTQESNRRTRRGSFSTFTQIIGGKTAITESSRSDSRPGGGNESAKQPVSKFGVNLGSALAAGTGHGTKSESARGQRAAPPQEQPAAPADEACSRSFQKQSNVPTPCKKNSKISKCLHIFMQTVHLWMGLNDAAILIAKQYCL